jgi:RHS repeat-associated protein
LDGDGLPGILTDQGDAWHFKPNLGDARFGPLEQLPVEPSLAALGTGRQALLDLAGDGHLDLVALPAAVPGFYERTRTASWAPFRPFQQLPNARWDDPNLRFVDLTGDGHADLIVSEDHVFTWHPSYGEAGFGPAQRVHVPRDEEHGPVLLMADEKQTIYLADMSGDGLTDLVRIRNGEVCYWPNIGYGRFGAKVTMDDAPAFDVDDQFSHERIRLADIDGSGTHDIIYLGRDTVRLYFNQSGNRWSEARPLSFPPVDRLASIATGDLLGTGTACLIWSSPLPGDAHRSLRYVSLMASKPHLLTSVSNSLGAQTTVHYAASTKFFLADRAAGKPWLTRLPFPVHCVDKVTIADAWRKTSFTTTYSYHHGHFDGVEREFRGFGRVDRLDVESYGEFSAGNAASPYITSDQTLYQPPVKTVTWYHTGAMAGRRLLKHFEAEFFPRWFEDMNPSTTNVLGGFEEQELPAPDFAAAGLSGSEWREGARACKGMKLREERYELDVDALETGEHRPVKIFSSAYHNCHVRRIQPAGPNRYAVFHATESELIAYNYELDLRSASVTPDPRISHTLNVNHDEYGQVLQSVTVVYPRFGQFQDASLSAADVSRIREVQRDLHLAYRETRYTNDFGDDDNHRLRVPFEVLSYELTGIGPEDTSDLATADTRDNRYFSIDELRRFRLSPVHQTSGDAVGDLDYHERPSLLGPEKRLVEHLRTLYFKDDVAVLDRPFPLGQLGRLGLPFETYTLALTDDLLAAVLGAKITPAIRASLEDSQVSGYLNGPALTLRFPADPPGNHWIRSGTAGYAIDARQHYCLPERFIDPFGNVTTVEYDPLDLFVASSLDAVGNETRVQQFDYRVLTPRVMSDPNDNISEARFDAFGRVTATALRGKGADADSLSGFTDVLANPVVADVVAFFTGAGYDEPRARVWLDQATSRHVYSFGEGLHSDGSVRWGAHPASSCGITRERHAAQLTPGEQSGVQATFEYSDGTGTVIVRKTQAEPAGTGLPMRWIANGKTVMNNKALPVKQYEPYFSSASHRFEEPTEEGVSSVVYYDALGRTIRTEAPDGSYSRVVFSPWEVTSYDANDTIAEPGNAWFARNSTSPSAADQRAATLAAAHADTPLVTVFDSLGRDRVTIQHNRVFAAGGGFANEKYLTFITVDAEGKPLWIRDARRNLVMQYIVPPVPSNQAADPAGAFVPAYDVAGNQLFQYGMDGGSRWTLNDAAGKSLFGWDENQRVNTSGVPITEHRSFFTRYDALHRPISSLATGIDPLNPGQTIEFERIVYGDSPGTGLTLAQRKQANLLGKAYRHHDASGLVTHERFDFKGNLLRSSRQFAADYRGVIDWAAGPVLAAETFVSGAVYDALDRRIQIVAPHRSSSPATLDVIQPIHNVANVLERLDAWLEHPAEPAALLTPATASQQFVAGVSYDARRRRERIEYGNGVVTMYEYDPLSFRLVRLRTLRAGTAVQDLQYTYDPVGNVTECRDAAQNAVFHSNACVQAGSRFVYDARYQLVAASGREHRGGDQQPSSDDRNRQVAAIPNDCAALRNYVETYRYDAAGNILQIRHHQGGDIDAPGAVIWNQRYQYALDSNRLLATSLPGDPILPDYAAAPGYSARYEYDIHGNMVRMPHLPAIDWSFRDQLRASTSQAAGGGAADRTFYAYEGSGERVRKVVERATGVRRSERLYFGEYELHRQYAADGVTVELERSTLHVTDDRQRLALVETRTRATVADPSPRQLQRYQQGDRLGSAVLELDQTGGVISYEEYAPFGATSYQAIRSGNDVPKRYRYCSKERDDETGLSHHGARYYALWLGRWTSADPLGIGDGTNLFRYVSNNPVNHIDPSGTQENNAHTSDHVTTRPPSLEETLAQISKPQDCRGFHTDRDKFKSLSPPVPLAPAQPAPQPAPAAPAAPAAAAPAGKQASAAPAPAPAQQETASSIPKLTKNEADTLHVSHLATVGFTNPYAQALAAQGKTHLAVIWESGFICSGCHLTHFSEGTNEDIDLTVFAWQVQMAAYAKTGLMLLSLGGSVGAIATASSPRPPAGGGFNVGVRNGRPVVMFGENAPKLGYEPNASAPPVDPSTLRPGPGTKVVAVTPNGPMVMSGVDDTAVGVYQQRTEAGYDHLSHFRDTHGTRGTYFSTHGEPKAYRLNPSGSITVSKAPCVGCIDGFRFEVGRTGKPLDIHAPTSAGPGTWTFAPGPDGIGVWATPFNNARTNW